MRRFFDKSTLTGRAVRYAIAGVAAALLYYLTVAGLVELGRVGPVPAATIATVVVILVQYVVNRRWIFPTDRSHASAFSRFAAASVVGILLNTGLMYVAVHVFEWRYWLGLILATIIVPPTNFLINNHWTFRAREVGDE